MKPGHIHSDPGGNGIVGNDPPREVHPRPQKNCDTIQIEQEGKGNPTYRVKPEEGRKSKEDTDGISQGRLLGRVFNMEKLFNQIS